MAFDNQKGRVITTGGMLKTPSGRNLGLQEAQNELAKCCGIDCCNNLIRLPDQSTGSRIIMYFEDGNLKFSVGDTVYVVTAIAEE